jgi:hypothetical protein
MVHLPTSSGTEQSHLELNTPKGYLIKLACGFDEQTLSRLLQVLEK